MATAVGLNMKITADTAGIGRGMNRTEKMLQGLQKSAASAAGSLRGLVAIEVGTRLASAFAGAAKSAVNYANSVRTAIDETAKVSQRTGIAVEALQGLQVAADLSGVGNFEVAMQKFTVVLGKASEDTAKAQETFGKLGINFQELEVMAPEDQFRAVSAAIAAIPGQANQAAAAVELFGKSGVELLPLFVSNLAEVEARANRLGIVLRKDQTSAIEEMNDALDLVGKTFDGIIGQVTANLAPIVTDITNEFLSFVESFQGFSGGGTGIADAITQGLLDFAEYLAGVFDSAIANLSVFGDIMQRAGEIFSFTANVFIAAAEALRGVFNTFEIIVNGLGFILGKAIENIVGLFSRGARNFGKTMAESATSELKKNAGEWVGAATNAGRAASAAIFGGDGSTSRGNGVASRAVQNARNMFTNRNSPAAQMERQRKQIEAQRQREATALAKKQEQIDAKRKKGLEDQMKLIEKVNEKMKQVEEDRAKRAVEIEEARLENLSRASNEALNVGDIRSGGVSEILRIAAGREDPAVEEYRKQLGELKKIDAKLGELRAEKVEIIGGGKGRAA